MAHDGLDCLTDGVPRWTAIIDDADLLSAGYQARTGVDPEDELRTMLPYLFARLSPEARGMIRDQISHVGEIVAFLHRVSPVTTR